MESRVYTWGGSMVGSNLRTPVQFRSFHISPESHYCSVVARSQRLTSQGISVRRKSPPEDRACIVQRKLGFFEVPRFFPRAGFLQPSLGKLSLRFLDVLVNVVEVLGGVVVHRSKVPDATPFGKLRAPSRWRMPGQFCISQGRLRTAISA